MRRGSGCLIAGLMLCRTAGAQAPAAFTPAAVRGIADLGAAGQYQDEYVKTPKGWKFASRNR
jgi:hypothetical protein